jgi:hypothetical protein
LKNESSLKINITQEIGEKMNVIEIFQEKTRNTMGEGNYGGIKQSERDFYLFLLSLQAKKNQEKRRKNEGRQDFCGEKPKYH